MRIGDGKAGARASVSRTGGISLVTAAACDLTRLSTKAVDNFVDDMTRGHAITAANTVITALVKK
jgi:hypothetical protein